MKYDIIKEFEERLKDDMLPFIVAEKDEYRKWAAEIPFLEFPSGWKVKIVPPFAGAIARFQVEIGSEHVSIYLDCYDRLGLFGAPYWEVYPYQGDTGRCAMNDTSELLRMIADRTKDSE
jgi:hypothetical protein